MRVVVVVESHWGNTEQVAERIAEGLREGGVGEVELLAPQHAPPVVPEDTGLLLVGGPTHAFSMTREKTRADAHQRGATSPVGPGIRDWVDASEPVPGLAVRTFDTRVRHVPGSAAKSAAKALHKHGWDAAQAGESFFVTGQEGPLADGELDRARAWGLELAGRTRLA
jgi:hypothetical protein